MQCVGPEGKGEGGLKNGWPREGPHGTAGWGDWVRLGGGCFPPHPGRHPEEPWHASPLSQHIALCTNHLFPFSLFVPTPTSVPV